MSVNGSVHLYAPLPHNSRHLFVGEDSSKIFGLAWISGICYSHFGPVVCKFLKENVFYFAVVIAHQLGHTHGLTQRNFLCRKDIASQMAIIQIPVVLSTAVTEVILTSLTTGESVWWIYCLLEMLCLWNNVVTGRRRRVWLSDQNISAERIDHYLGRNDDLGMMMREWFLSRDSFIKWLNHLTKLCEPGGDKGGRSRNILQSILGEAVPTLDNTRCLWIIEKVEGLLNTLAVSPLLSGFSDKMCVLCRSQPIKNDAID